MKLPAHKSGQFVGWLSLSEKQSFAWALRIEVSDRAAVMVPVRVENRDRGWTHYHFADLSAVPAYQVNQLVYSGHLTEVAANEGDSIEGDRRHGAAA
ncbi:MAG TPA: hypothetical protein VM915_10470 [Verrucomicrobiae bacterium]|nr:hypothetical protein [Verrucomicrobiae bacterium]